MIKNILFILSLILVVLGYQKVYAQEIEWSKSFGAGSNQYAHFVKQLSDNGFILTGLGSLPEADSLRRVILLLKTDVNGDIIFQSTPGSSAGIGSEFGVGLLETSDSGYIILARTRPIDSSGELRLIKTNLIGEVEWSKDLGSSSSGGIFGFGGYSIRSTMDGGPIIAGGNVVIKADSAGEIDWERNFGCCDTLIYSIRETPTGDFISVGKISNEGGSDILVGKFNPDGAFIWVNRYNFSEVDWANDVDLTTDGYIVTGVQKLSSYDAAFLLRLDNFGTVLWDKNYGVSGRDMLAYSVKTVRDSGYIIAGHVNELDVSWQAMALRVDIQGDFLWEFRIGGSTEWPP